MGKIKVFLITVVLIVVMLFAASKEYKSLTAALNLNERENINAALKNMFSTSSSPDASNSNTPENTSYETDNYVVNNSNYKNIYTRTVNKYIKQGKGYVSLNRILYFYNANQNLSFDEIYLDNIDTDNKQKRITDTCKMDKYKDLYVCEPGNIDTTNQMDYKTDKPFSMPVDISSMTITSYFMENRSYENHKAWDFAANSGTDVKAVCDGVVTSAEFGYTSNYPSRGYGNKIVIKCSGSDYNVLYAHLYPGSNRVSTGSTVKKGDVIASVGNTGYSTGSHLHFQVENSNSYVDGMSLIKF